MSSKPIRNWHIAHWPTLAWFETIIKLAALVLGAASGWQALSNFAFRLPSGWRLIALAVLTILALGLLIAIFDRWRDKEIVAMIFVIINNLGHWGMVVSLAALPWPRMTLLIFSGLMLLGDGVKLIFIRVHQFTVREFSSSILIRLTAVYLVGYAILFTIALLITL